MNSDSALPHILLVEPQFVLRRTIVAVAHKLAIGQVREATSVDVAASLLAAERFDGIVLDTANAHAALELLARLRKGGFATDAQTPVIALQTAADSALDKRLQPHRLHSTLHKPFKVAELLAAVQQMALAAA